MSFTFQKYYDDAAVEAPAAPAFNIAEIMAKSGVKTDNDVSGSVPDIQIEDKTATTPAAPAAAAETAPAPVNSGPNGVEPPQPTPQPAAAPAKQDTAADWKAQLKQADIVEVLKELGYDDKMVGFLQRWKTNGNVDEYLRAATMDYSKLTPEDLMRHQLQEEYQGLAPEDFEELYRMKVVEQYKLDPDMFTEAEVRRGKILLGLDAKKVRDGLVKTQQDFLLPKPPEGPDPAIEAKRQEDSNKQIAEQYSSNLEADPVTKALRTSKKLVFGQGDDTFNYEIEDPEKILQVLKDPGLWAQNIFNEDWTPKTQKQLALAAVNIDHEKVFSEIFKHGKTLGAKQAIEQIENAKLPGVTTSQPEGPLTPAQALAKQGVITSNS